MKKHADFDLNYILKLISFYKTVSFRHDIDFVFKKNYLFYERVAKF